MTKGKTPRNDQRHRQQQQAINQRVTWGRTNQLRLGQVARVSSTGRLFLIPPNGASMTVPPEILGRRSIQTVRELTQQGEMLCPVNECGPYGYVRSCTNRVDHFGHHPSTSDSIPHDAESVEHAAAKIALSAWLEHAFGAELVELRVDDLALKTPSGATIRPDVYGVLKNGKQLVLEYEASVKSRDNVIRRHRIYRDMGIQDFWFFGPRTATCNVVPIHGKRTAVAPNGDQQELFNDGACVLWFDLSSNTIGMPAVWFWRHVGSSRRAMDAGASSTLKTKKSYWLPPSEVSPASVRYVLLHEYSAKECRLDLDQGELLHCGRSLFSDEERRMNGDISKGLVEPLHIKRSPRGTGRLQQAAPYAARAGQEILAERHRRSALRPQPTTPLGTRDVTTDERGLSFGPPSSQSLESLDVASEDVSTRSFDSSPADSRPPASEDHRDLDEGNGSIIACSLPEATAEERPAPEGLSWFQRMGRWLFGP